MDGLNKLLIAVRSQERNPDELPCSQQDVEDTVSSSARCVFLEKSAQNPHPVNHYHPFALGICVMLSKF
jgi:hypothetical protein